MSEMKATNNFICARCSAVVVVGKMEAATGKRQGKKKTSAYSMSETKNER